MRNLFILVTSLIVALGIAGNVFAASPSIVVRIEQPKSPTNVNNLTINVVAFDTKGRTVTIQCYKKGPSDGAFTPFGSTITLKPGGNSANCEASTVLSAEGTYEVYAVATADSDTSTSPTISFDYKTSGPGTPSAYQKEKNSCVYIIKFRSADDGGKTIKVNVYRSENTSFNLDNGSLVGGVSLGSNTDGQFPDTAPDCSKTYYYAVRAFDAAGNGSGVVGDSETHTTTTTTTTTAAPTKSNGPTGTVSGAVQPAIAAGSAGNVWEQQKAQKPRKQHLGTPQRAAHSHKRNLPQRNHSGVSR